MGRFLLRAVRSGRHWGPLPGKDKYLKIVRLLAGQRGSADIELEEGTERWAIDRGGLSPRRAKQYIRAAEARIKSGLLPQ